MKASTSPGEEVPPGNRRFMYYIDVEDLASIVSELQPKLAAAASAPMAQWTRRTVSASS